MKMKQFGLTETKLFHFHRTFKNVGGVGVQAKENNSISIYAFCLILCMFTMYLCCISFVFMNEIC